MPYHVEIRRSLQRAWTFNLDEQELEHRVLGRWRRGVAIELGDREWNPRECKLKVLEGPALSPPELSLGQGWQNARRAGADVTVRVLGPLAPANPPVAVLATDPEGAAVAESQLQGLGLSPIDWAEVHPRMLSAAAALPSLTGAAAGIGAALLVVGRRPPQAAWYLGAGMALATLGTSAVLAVYADAPTPALLTGVAVVRLGAEHPPAQAALATRLRQAGYDVGI